MRALYTYTLYMYIYQCYVTDPWWQCDLVTVEKGVKKDWDPDSQTITVTTNSEAESNNQVIVSFFDTVGGDAGLVEIYFGAEIQYKIGGCSSDPTSFTAAPLPAETEKTWTITYNYTDKRVVYYCNGVLVADVVLSNSACRSGWEYYWGSKPTQMQFGMDGMFGMDGISDTASDTYCFSSNPGKYNGVIDSGE